MSSLWCRRRIIWFLDLSSKHLKSSQLGQLNTRSMQTNSIACWVSHGLIHFHTTVEIVGHFALIIIVLLTFLTPGSLCFICEDDSSPTGTVQTQHCCPLCPRLPLSIKYPSKIIDHMAAHILLDPIVRGCYNPCGFCCRRGDIEQCVVWLCKIKGQANKWAIDIENLKCKNGNVVNFNLASRAESTSSSPLTNIPINCPLCKSGSPAVWKYNFCSHIVHAHENANPDEYREYWEIKLFEKGALKALWTKKSCYSVQKLGSVSSLKISDDHSVQVNIR